MRSKHTLTRADAKKYLRIGITPIEIVRLRWPDASAHFADYVLWELTPFPLCDGLDDIADAVADAPEPVWSRPDRPTPTKERGIAA